MRLSRRGLILGGSAMLAGCATGQATPLITQAQAPVAPPLSVISQAPAPVVVSMNAAPPLDPRGQVRKELMERAVAALDVHHKRIPLRDRMYLVDFQKYSGDERLYEVDMVGGQVTVLRTCHGRGSDPAHSGYAKRFSNTPDSNLSLIHI